MTELARAFLIFLSLAVPATCFGGALAGVRGAVGGLVLAAASELAAFLLAERIQCLAHSAQTELPAGLSRTVERVAAALGPATPGPNMPRIRVFSDPAPSALVARSLGGHGTVLVSQGLLALLDEEELRDVLRALLLGARARGIVVRSASAALASAVLGLAPKRWSRLVFGGAPGGPAGSAGPGAALAFAAFFPPARFYLSMSRPIGNPPLPGSSARRRLAEAVSRLGPGCSLRSAAASHLYLSP
jgi:Zn-dependent protease with chaperone function